MELDVNRGIDWSIVWEWALRIGAALLILLVTHFVAKAVKWAVAKIVDKIPVLQRHSSAQPGETVGGQIGTLAYWIVWLVGLVVALQPLQLSEVITPINSLTNEVFVYLPRIIGAGLILFFGFILANIVRRIVETFLMTVNADGWLARAGATDLTGGPDTVVGAAATTPKRNTLSSAIGVIVFVLIIIPIATAALDVLAIDAISGPLTRILNDVAYFVPRIVAAGLILGGAFLIGRWVRQWLEQVLGALGVNRSLAGTGLLPETVDAGRVLGTVALTAIMLFAAVAAIEVLEIQSIQGILRDIIELTGRVIFGIVIVAVGIMLARVLTNLMASSTGETGWLPTIVKWAIIALFVAMGLSFMEIADEIVVLAFGLVLGSAAIACALAFGLGGRPTAHKLLERWTEEGLPPMPSIPAPPAPPTPPTPPPLDTPTNPFGSPTPPAM